MTVMRTLTTRTSSDNGTYAATLPGAGPVLRGSRIIIDAISALMRSGMRLTASDVARMANTQIAKAQRFWSVELDQASEALAVAFSTAIPGGASQAGWRNVLQNNFGWRIVLIQACRVGYEMDRVTRECVLERKPAPVTTAPADLTTPAPDALPPPDWVPAGAANGIPVWLIGVGAVAALMLFRK